MNGGGLLLFVAFLCTLWQYRDRRNLKAGTILLSYQTTQMCIAVHCINSAFQYNRQQYSLQTLVQFISLHSITATMTTI